MKPSFFCIIFLFILSSCAYTNYMAIDVRQPALITLPSDAENILIVDNISTHQKSSETNKNIESISIDSAKQILIDSFHQFMNEEEFFNKVDVYPYNTGVEGYYDNDIPLDRELITNICNRTNSDILISFDQLNISAELSEETFSNTLEVKLSNILRIYTNDGIEVAPPLVYMDSLYWDQNINAGRPKMIPLKSAVSEITVKTADILSNAFIPWWDTQERWYYSDNSSKMKEASTFVKRGKWEEAANIWANEFEKEKKLKKRIRLASNLALANESLDDIENALNWIDIAYDMFPDNSQSGLAIEIVKYKTILENRDMNRPRLDEQLRNNIDEE